MSSAAEPAAMLPWTPTIGIPDLMDWNPTPPFMQPPRKMPWPIELKHSQNPIDELMRDATEVRHATDNAAMQCKSLEDRLAGLRSQKEGLFVQDAPPAMDALFKFVEDIESLYHFREEKMASHLSKLEVYKACEPRVRACKSQAGSVYSNFRFLYNKSKCLMDSSSQLATDFTYQVSSAQTRSHKLQGLEEQAKILQNGAETQRNSLIKQKNELEDHIRKAQDTIRVAKNKAADDKLLRVMRAILGAGGLKQRQSIKGMEETVKNAIENAQKCHEIIASTEASLQRVDAEIKTLDSLGSSAHAEEGRLKEIASHSNGLRKQTNELTKASLDVTFSLGILAAKSESLPIHYTVQDFARGVRDFSEALASTERLNGLLIEHNPEALRETLNMIIHSEDENKPNKGDLM